MTGKDLTFRLCLKRTGVLFERRLRPASEWSEIALDAINKTTNIILNNKGLTKGMFVVVVRVPQRKSGSAIPTAHNWRPLGSTRVNAQFKA